jgi:hypothetical protein
VLDVGFFVFTWAGHHEKLMKDDEPREPMDDEPREPMDDGSARS